MKKVNSCYVIVGLIIAGLLGPLPSQASTVTLTVDHVTRLLARANHLADVATRHRDNTYRSAAFNDPEVVYLGLLKRIRGIAEFLENNKVGALVNADTLEEHLPSAVSNRGNSNRPQSRAFEESVGGSDLTSSAEGAYEKGALKQFPSL